MRLLPVLLALLLVVPSAMAIPDARLTIDDATVTPSTPAVGEPTTVSVTVSDAAGSPSAVNLTRVDLRDESRLSGERVLATATRPGALSPGGSLTLDLSTTFDRAGTHELTVVAVGRDSDGEEVRVQRPLTVVVERAPPQLDFERPTLVAGAETRIPVTVSNPNAEAVRNVQVSFAVGDARDTRPIPTIAGGASVTVNVTLTPASTGSATLETSVSYLTDTGAAARTTSTTPVEVEPLRADVELAVRPVSPDDDPTTAAAGQLGGLLGAGGGQLQQQDDEGASTPDRLAVEVTNFGNARVTDGVLTPVADRPLPRVAVPAIAPGESVTVEIDLSTVRTPTNVTARLAYETGGESFETVGSYPYRPPAGDLRLTGIDLERDGDIVRITGNAGNVGDGEVTGVVVAVGETDHVTPAYPSRDYFVGTVEGSAFAPFELTARADANATEVPIEVTYRVGGEVRTETITVPYEVEEPQQSRGPLGLGLAVGGGVFVLVVAGAAAFVSRR
ncbi:CARDB domain-containing protein [Natronomonas sp. EA1]|uniref:CARDB domain-containing protein n=1 Tax=Natronomonas sp. EA1 TaxID=3421655 RepID=UPI003EC14355